MVILRKLLSECLLGFLLSVPGRLLRLYFGFPPAGNLIWGQRRQLVLLLSWVQVQRYGDAREDMSSSFTRETTKSELRKVFLSISARSILWLSPSR